jgi:hypothetical protein
MAFAGKVGETTPSIRDMGGSRRPLGAVAAGVAVGLLVGAGMALLLAPQTGSDARRSMVRRLRRARLRGADAWHELGFELRRARRRLKRARRSRELDAMV